MLLYFDLVDRPNFPVFFAWNFSRHTAGLNIPPTLLIAFAENAIKHGVANDPTRPIRIRLDISDYTIRFSCRNRIKPTPDRKSHGSGLANTRRRLEIQYAGAYTLETYPEEDDFVVELTIGY